MAIVRTRATTTHKQKYLIELLPAVGVSILAFLVSAFAFYAPPETGEMAVVFPPGTSETAAYGAIVDAGGRIVGTSRFNNVVVAYAPDEGFRHRIGNYGGWFTLAAEGLCSSINSNSLSEMKSP